MAPSLTVLSSQPTTTLARRATQYQDHATSLLVDPNPVILGLLIFVSCILFIASFIGIAVWAHGRNSGFGRKSVRRARADVETKDEYSVGPKARLASPRAMQERGLRPLSLLSGTSTIRTQRPTSQIQQPNSDNSTDSSRESTPPKETLPERYTLTLNCDLPNILAAFQPSPDPPNDNSRDNPSVASPEQPSLALTSPVPSNASVMSFGDNSLVRYASELFVKLDTQTGTGAIRTELEEICETSQSSCTVKLLTREKRVEPPSSSGIHLEKERKQSAPVHVSKPLVSCVKDIALLARANLPVAKPKMSTVRLGPGFVILAIRIATVGDKSKDGSRRRPLTKRLSARIVAGVRHKVPRKERSSWNCVEPVSAVFHSQILVVSRMRTLTGKCSLTPIRRFLLTKQSKLPLGSFCVRHSFLEISAPEQELDIADLVIASEKATGTKTSCEDGDISETQDITELTATSYCSVGNETSCGDENVAITQELGSFFAWNDDTTTVDSQTHIPSVTGDDNHMANLVKSSASNILQVSSASGNVIRSESSSSSFLEKTVRRATEALEELKRAQKENSPKVSSPKEKPKRNGSQKSRRHTSSMSPPLRPSPFGRSIPSAPPQFPTISIAINGVPASDSHYSSSFYVELASDRVESTAPLSPELLNTEWAPRPPLRERLILLSLRLTSRGFGALRGRSLGCYAMMESTLDSVKCSVEEQLGYEVVLRGMVRASTLPVWDIRRNAKGEGASKGQDNNGDEWVYATIADDAMFAKWVEDRVLADGEGAALDVCIAEKRWF